MSQNVQNRAKRAREHAGISIGQAARLLGMTTDELLMIEERDSSYANADQSRLAEIYCVNLEWLSGTSERYDYETVKNMRGADSLTFHDRDIIAEFAASMPRKPAKTLAEIRNEKDLAGSDGKSSK